MARNKRPKRIAPRLANGERRARLYIGVPEELKEAARMRAALGGESTSWSMEQQVLAKLFPGIHVEYVPRKTEREKQDRKLRRVK